MGSIKERIEQIFSLLIITSFCATSLWSFVVFDNPVTKEEAISISRTSCLVREGLEIAYRSNVYVDFYNWSRVKELKDMKELPNFFWITLPLPEGHDLWEVVWDINMGLGGYLIIVNIDANNGWIIRAEKGVQYS